MHRPARPLLAVAAVLCLTGSACGARLSQTQTAAVRQLGAGTTGQTGTGTSALGGTGTGGGAVTGGAGGVAAGPGGTTGSTVTGGGGTTKTSGGATSGGATTKTGTTAAGGSSALVSISPKVCHGAASGPGVSKTEIDVGNVSTLTGPIPGLFLGAVHGMQAFAAYVNSIGGICGRKLVVKSADDNLQVSQNATATQSLANSVFAFVGSFSADDQGGATVLKSNGIPDVGQALSKQRFDLPNNFSPEPIAGWNAAPFLLFKKRYPNAATHMAILGSNQPTGQFEYQAEKRALESVGYKFVYTDPNIEPTQTDFSADAQAMKSAGAQGVAWASTAPLLADLAKAIQNAGITPFPLGTYATTAYDQVFLQDAGSAAEGATLEVQEAMYQGEDAQSVPMVGLFDKWYAALYHSKPDEFAMYSWLSGLLFIDGLNAGGAITRPALLSGLKKITHFTGGGIVATDNPAQKKPPLCYLIIDVKNGKFVRDSSDPRSGFNCQFAPHYFYYNG